MKSISLAFVAFTLAKPTYSFSSSSLTTRRHAPSSSSHTHVLLSTDASPPQSSSSSSTSTTALKANIYDDWSLDLLSTSQSPYTYDDLIVPCEEETIEECLEEFMESDYGKTMFGRHDVPASVGWVLVFGCLRSLSDDDDDGVGVPLTLLQLTITLSSVSSKHKGSLAQLSLYRWKDQSVF